MARQNRKIRWIAILSALLINGIFVSVLGLAWIDREKQVAIAEAKKPPPLPVRLYNVKERPDAPPEIDTEELKIAVEREQQRLADVPEEKKVQAVNEAADWIERNSNEQSVQAILDMIKPAFEGPQRAYAPVSPAPEGRFDSDSSIPYQSVKVTDAKGIERFEHTLVDKEGRTMVYLTRREQSAEGRILVFYGSYLPDGTVYESSQPDTETGVFTTLLERMNSSPVLNRIFRQVVQPGLAAEQVKQQNASKEADSAPESRQHQIRSTRIGVGPVAGYNTEE